MRAGVRKDLGGQSCKSPWCPCPARTLPLLQSQALPTARSAWQTQITTRSDVGRLQAAAMCHAPLATCYRLTHV